MKQSLFKTRERLEQNDIGLITQLSDELNKYQPLVLAIMLSLQEKHPLHTVDELMKLYFLIWSHFRSVPECLKRQLSEDTFEAAYKRNLNMLKYLEGESIQDEKTKITQSDLLKVKSRDLLVMILHCLNNWSQLKQLSTRDKSLELLAMKSLIESFERFSNG